MKKSRRKFSSEYKTKVILEALQERLSMSDLLPETPTPQPKAKPQTVKNKTS